MFLLRYRCECILLKIRHKHVHQTQPHPYDLESFAQFVRFGNLDTLFFDARDANSNAWNSRTIGFFSGDVTIRVSSTQQRSASALTPFFFCYFIYCLLDFALFNLLLH